MELSSKLIAENCSYLEKQIFQNIMNGNMQLKINQ
jgi:hypothetical protein